MNIVRVTALPQAPEANTLYLIAETDGLSIAAVGASGEVVHQTLPGLAVKSGVLEVSGTKQVRAGEDGNNAAVVKDVVLKKAAINFYDNQASYAINYANGSAQRFAPTADDTVVFSGFTDGQLCELLIEGVNLGARTITWPAGMQWLKSDGTFTSNFAESGVVLNTEGLDFVLFWTRDNGTTIYGKVFR